ncbi:hypothetical protein TWF506_006004 [Arthrobotrys conoides]|uniref:Uncharacterized protein n=1 Tax=Arthrobotrys conoides TaxID=74498 RepID=A0AAN8RNN5_9PEZI
MSRQCYRPILGAGLSASRLVPKTNNTLDASKTASPEKREDKLGKTLRNWKGILKSSQVDVALACEAHKHGLAFLTADEKM